MNCRIVLVFLFQLMFSCMQASAASPEIRYADKISNARHPQIGFWFITPETLSGDAYLDDIEEYSKIAPFDLIFLTARRGISFFDVERMHPVFERLVQKADSLGIGIGLSLYDWCDAEYNERDCSRTIVETETKLDSKGMGVCFNKAMNVKLAEPFKHELFKVYAFKKVGKGVYEPGTLHDITDSCVQEGTPGGFTIKINAGEDFAGYDVYAMSEICYKCFCVYSGGIGRRYHKLMEAYSDIPFKGMAFDEFTHMRVKSEEEKESGDKTFKIRLYSLAMKAKYESVYNRDLDEDLFKMRYSPQDDDTEKIRAVNLYMDLMRKGPLDSENDLVRYARKVFGADIFIGFHNTFHNAFTNDEIWTSGINWWTLTRDYGHSDEQTPAGIQMGIGMSYAQNVMYNMYYDWDIDKFATKALTDLRYGIRTIYHAFNDRGKWGTRLEDPDLSAKIRKVERMAVLANRFNSTFAGAKILVVAGMEALANWYPDEPNRGVYEVNHGLLFQKRAKDMWNAGYLNAMVPSDLIENGTLSLNEENKPTLNGYTFDAVVYLNPQYAKCRSLKFISDYAEAGGKLLIEGIPQKDFYANDLTDWWNGIADKVTVVGYSIENVGQLGVPANPYKNGNPCVDGAFVQTDYESLNDGTQTVFSIAAAGHVYTGKYQGFVALGAGADNQIERFAAGMCSELLCDGEIVFNLKNPADLVMTRNKDGYIITVAGTESYNKLTYHQ